MANVTYSFSLNTEEDADLKRWLDGFSKRERSLAIREALRRGLGYTAGVTLADVYQAVRELDRKLARGVVLAGNAGDLEAGDPADDEPPDVAAALDSLGL